MEVILLEKIRHLGALGATVNVAGGYGRNFLVPKGKALYATKENLKKFELRRAELERVAAEALAIAEQRQQALLALNGVITLSAKVGEEGKLFGSIGSKDIAEAILKAGVDINKNEIILSAGPLRHAGLHEVSVAVHSDVIVVLQVNIVPIE